MRAMRCRAFAPSYAADCRGHGPLLQSRKSAPSLGPVSGVVAVVWLDLAGLNDRVCGDIACRAGKQHRQIGIVAQVKSCVNSPLQQIS